MRLRNVKLRGLIGIKRGLGLDEVEVDLSSLRGVVGIVGENGTGKTTFMECLQPFRVMPSRKVGDTDKPLLFKDAVCLRQSWKDLTFEMNGKKIRVQVTADCDSDKQDGYIWVDDEPFSTGKVTEVDEQLLKHMGTPELLFASVFAAQSAKSLMHEKKAVRKEFFAEFLGLAQYQVWSDTAKNVAGYVAGIIDQGRSTIEQLELASAGAALERETVAALRAEAEQIDVAVSEAAEAVRKGKLDLQTAENLYQQQEAIHAAVGRLEKQLQDLTTDYNKTQEQRREESERHKQFLSASHTWSSERNRELFALEFSGDTRIEPYTPKDFTVQEIELSDIAGKLERQRQLLRDIQTLENQIDSQRIRTKSENDRRHAERARMRGGLERSQKVHTGLTGEIAMARAAYDEGVAGRPFGGSKTVEELEAIIRAHRDLSESQRKLEATISSTETEFAVRKGGLEHGLRESRTMAALAEKIPATADRTICGDCGFAKHSLRATENVARLTEEIAELERSRIATVEPLKAGVLNFEEQRAAAEKAREEIRLTQLLAAKLDAIHSMESRQLEQAQVQERFVADIAASEKETTDADRMFEEYATGVRQGIADVSVGIDENLEHNFGVATESLRQARKADTDAVRAEQERVRKIDTLKASMAERETQCTERAQRVEAISDAINDAFRVFTERKDRLRGEIQQEATRLDPELEEKITLMRGQSRAAQGVAFELEETRKKVAMRLNMAESKLASTEQAEIQLQAARRENIAADTERAEWALLQNICGRDRLQALELDAAAPAITGIANQLLGQCFGGRFSINFETLDGNGREVFDLMVTDAHSGKGEDVRLKSGGQKVINLHALRLAKTMYMKERSGRDYKSLFLDECDGALSSDVRREFAEMNRMAMRMGGFETMFIVSHSPEVIDTVDRIIEFGNGRITVR